MRITWGMPGLDAPRLLAGGAMAWESSVAPSIYLAVGSSIGLDWSAAQGPSMSPLLHTHSVVAAPIVPAAFLPASRRRGSAGL
jgi:hypothetical protein